MATSILDQPVASLELVTWQRLGGDLTIKNSRNRDWTGVAGCVGFSSKQVESLQQHHNSGNDVFAVFDCACLLTECKSPCCF